MTDDRDPTMAGKILPFESSQQPLKPVTKEECDGLSALAQHLIKIRGLDKKKNNRD